MGSDKTLGKLPDNAFSQNVPTNKERNGEPFKDLFDTVSDEYHPDKYNLWSSVGRGDFLSDLGFTYLFNIKIKQSALRAYELRNNE